MVVGVPLGNGPIDKLKMLKLGFFWNMLNPLKSLKLDFEGSNGSDSIKSRFQVGPAREKRLTWINCS